MRLFIAIDIPKEIQNKIRKTQNQLKKHIIGTFPKPENLHLTLKFLGEVSEEQKDNVIQELKKIKFKPFKLNLKGLGAFPSENYIRVVWIGSENNDITKLAGNIEEALEKFKFKKTHNYKTHLTIARAKKILDKSVLKNTLTELKEKNFGEATVDSIKLYKSILHSTGPVYTLLETFPLTK